MTSCLSKLKVTPKFCFPFKISDDPTASNIYTYMTSLLEQFVIKNRILTHFFNDRKKLLIFALRLGVKCAWSSSWSCAPGYSSSWSSAPSCSSSWSSASSCSTRGGYRRGCTYTCTSLKEKKIKKNYTNYQVIIDQQIIFKILNKSFKLQSYLQYLRYAILGRSRCSGIVCWNLWWVCCWDWRCWLSRIMWCLTLLSRKGCKGLKSLTKKMYMSR